VLPLAALFGVVRTATLSAQQKAPAKTLGFDAAAIDRGADPCTDFYQYACGAWMKNNPVPADQASWGRFNELVERNRNTLRDLLAKMSEATPGRTPLQQKLGDYYASCMDETSVEAAGAKPLDDDMKAIAAVQTKEDLPAVIGRLQRQGVDAFFAFGAEQDFKDSATVMAIADQGGLGLPDRDYYFKEDATIAAQRNQYVTHIAHMFVIAGDRPPQAGAEARSVMKIETALAKNALDRVSRRDPNAIYNKMSRAELTAMNTAFAWDSYLTATGAPQFANINVTEPKFFKGIDEVIAATSLEELKTYLRWHVIHAAAPTLSSQFVNENFEFYGKVLTGRTELQPRWKRCVTYTDGDLGEALGELYVEATFGADGKRRMVELVANLEGALSKDINGLEWMTPATRKQALAKMATFTKKIGYPDKWRDYNALTIVRGDLLGNSKRANEFEHRRQLAKIGQPVDRGEWAMSPPTVNAYYNPLMNEIVFPAGILQPPFFDRSADEAVNYGAIGAVIGHEMTHGFDDQGRQFDKEGNLKDWWTKADGDSFTTRAACVKEQYDGYSVVDDLKVNGALTLGENVADNGGVRIAHMALLEALGGKTPAKIDGFTAEQRFFLGYSQVWCENVRPEQQRLMVTTNPHSPGRYRVNGVVSNSPEFAKAFSCKAGQPMVKPNQCRVW
jgi:endothelin-converting enzyme/putative endopeptidase